MLYPELRQKLLDNLKELDIPIDEIRNSGCWIPIRRSLANENPIYPKLLWIGELNQDKIIKIIICHCRHDSISNKPYMRDKETYFCPIDKAIAYIARTYFEEIDT